MIWYFVILAVLVGLFFLVWHKKKKKKIYPFVLAETSNDEDDFINLLNLFRIKKGLISLYVDEFACNLAHNHNINMVQLGTAYHEKPNPYFATLEQRGATYLDEIVNSGFSTIESAFKGFVNSKDHNMAMSDPNINACGISILKNEKGKYFVTVILFRI